MTAPPRPSVDALDALDDVFTDLGVTTERPQGKKVPSRSGSAAKPYEPKAGRQRKSQNVSGLGMFVLAVTCLTLGGWLGSQMQAYAYGYAGETVQDLTAMRSFDPAAGLRY